MVMVHCTQKILLLKIDKPLLQKIAHLAQLEVGAHSEAVLLEELNKIVTWAEKLKEVDTAGVKPLVTMTLEHNVFQEDTPQAPLAHEKGLANAPSKDTNYFRVPQVKDR
jgi:aspartyl-tRNA(Asn)/glutamyl-tRNA(Gln) amidotransferase subunit C